MMSQSLNTYFENLKNADHADDLKQLQDFLKAQLPDATETLHYNMPTYFQNEQVVVSMASQRHYMSLYMDVDLLAANKEALGGLDCGKSCIRFKKFEDLPLETIGDILQQTVEKQATD